jgi:hypothetical protein
MDRHRRMGRTLGCLVASMTVGAVVLDWGQPNRPHSKTPEIALIARGNDAPPWSSIRVAPQPASATQSKDTHFLVDREGRCVPTDHWLKQHRLGRESVVRVALVSSAHANDVTAPQWATAQQLVGALQQTCNIPPPRVVFDDTLAVPPPTRSRK